MSSCSNIVMQSNEVADMAGACLKRIAAWRERERRAYCELERKAASTRFWAWLTRSPLPTDEEICDGWKTNDTVFCPAFFISMLGWESERIAQQLLAASKHATEVSVSIRDLEYVLP